MTHEETIREFTLIQDYFLNNPIDCFTLLRNLFPIQSDHVMGQLSDMAKFISKFRGSVFGLKMNNENSNDFPVIRGFVLCFLVETAQKNVGLPLQLPKGDINDAKRLEKFNLFQKFEKSTEFKEYNLDHGSLHSSQSVSHKLFFKLGEMLNLSSHFPLLYYSQLLLKVKHDCFDESIIFLSKNPIFSEYLGRHFNRCFFQTLLLSDRPGEEVFAYSLGNRPPDVMIERHVGIECGKSACENWKRRCWVKMSRWVAR